MRQINSETTMSLVGRDSAIGTPRGEHGLETSESLRLAGWLAQHRPDEVDAAAVWRASQLNVDIRVRFDHRFPRDARGNSLPVVSVVQGCDVSGSPADRAAAAEALRKIETPAPQRAIEGWLAELSVIVAKRQDDEFSEALRLEAFAGRLRKYPADVARHAILGTSWQFWPTWAEMERICDNLAAPRRAMIAALSMTGENREPRINSITRERAEQIVAEIYGSG